MSSSTGAGGGRVVTGPTIIPICQLDITIAIDFPWFSGCDISLTYVFAIGTEPFSIPPISLAVAAAVIDTPVVYAKSSVPRVVRWQCIIMWMCIVLVTKEEVGKREVKARRVVCLRSWLINVVH